jgi:hypothetical protein
VKISDVHWVANQLGQAAQDLKLDGRQAHFKTRQRSQFVARGILEGVSFLNSERPDAKENPYVRDSYPLRSKTRSWWDAQTTRRSSASSPGCAMQFESGRGTQDRDLSRTEPPSTPQKPWEEHAPQCLMRSRRARR